MSRKSTLKNLKKERKQPISEQKPIIVSDGGDEMESIYTPIKNPRNAKPIINSRGLVAYKVADVKV